MSLISDEEIIASVDSDDEDAQPFNLADVFMSVDDEDALPQQDIFESIFLRQEGAEAVGRSWDRTTPINMKLSSLKNAFERGDNVRAIQLLHKRVNLHVDDQLCYQVDDPNLLWHGATHFLDFTLIVAGSLGLHAFLPNKTVDHTFSMTLNLGLQSRAFRPKFGKLGFDPTGSMMAIGTTQSANCWLGFCPVDNMENLDIANDAPQLNEKYGDTRLSYAHFKMAVMFMAHCLSLNPDLPIHVIHPYGVTPELTGWSIKDATNVW